MKIALIGYEANIKNRVGSNQYAFELMWSLWRLDKENEYLVFLPSSPLPDLPPERKNWIYKVTGPQKLWNFLALPWALFREKSHPEVVFVPGHYAPTFSPAPLVISIMDLGFLRFPQHFTKPIFWKLKYWTAFSAKRASFILAISQSTKDEIVKYYQIDSRKITVSYPGYDQERFKIQRDGSGTKVKIDEVKKKYKIKGNYILFLSTLKPSKNVEGLLEAFKILNKRELKLVIAGRKGWMFEKIFQQVEKLSLEERVIFTDFVSEKDVPFLMKGAEVFVLPSFWEGFGIPLLEAMALGVPVVAGRVGSLPEVVGKAGILVDPYKPQNIALGIKRALENKEKLVKLGYQQVKKFSWEKTAQQTLAVLEKAGGKKEVKND